MAEEEHDTDRAPPAGVHLPVPTVDLGEHIDTAWDEGRMITRRYQLERLLGSGAMGDVWLAQDTLLNKQVAIKVLRSEIAENRDTVRRFLREVALAHSVTHPRVVRIYDTGEAQGRPFFTMEYLQGKTLEELLETPQGQEGGLELKQLRRIASDVLDGLDAAHRVGVVHRDLKPGNVMLTHGGAIVMDFGVAGIEESPSGPLDAAAVRSLVKTEAGTIFGSPAYMAPELWDGAPASITTDLYAFGVMLYQMVTGRLPFQASSPAAYLQQSSAGRPRPIRSLRRETPWYLARLIRRCMSPQPDARPPTAAAAANMIAPLRNEGRRRLIVGGLAASAALGVGLWVRSPMERRQRGLPDAITRTDLSAAVRMFDIGEVELARRQFDRLGRRSPGSAAVRFWRAVSYHALGDSAGRIRACEDGDAPHGSRNWRALAESACGPEFSLGEVGADELENPGSTGIPELLPLAVRWHLLERLEAEPSGDGPVRRESETVLAALAEHREADEAWELWARHRLARVDLQIGLGRTEEAAQRLSTLIGDHPEVPVFAVRGAWLATHQGNTERARALAEKLRPVDPRPFILEQLASGQMRAAWEALHPYRDTPTGAGLRTAWCGYAWRFEVQPRPPQCQDLPAGLIRDLWSGAGLESTSASALDQGILASQSRLDALDCTPHTQGASVLTHAPPGFELFSAELELQGALCEADPTQTDVARAQEIGSRLVAVAPENPWVLATLAKADDARGASAQASARRLAAVERWRNADADLPYVAALRRSLDQAPAGPRTAKNGANPAAP